MELRTKRAMRLPTRTGLGPDPEPPGERFERLAAAAAPGPEKVPLRDGAEIVIRPIEPTDKQELVRAFEGLSAESRYRRFLTAAIRLSPRMLHYLTEVDHHDHEALIAETAGGREPVGVARFIRLTNAPRVAEAAVVVVDDWQGKGAGTALLSRLVSRALEEGVEHFTATCLAWNHDMLELFEEIGTTQVVDTDGGIVEVDVTLPTRDAHKLRAAMRGAASGAQRLPVAL